MESQLLSYDPDTMPHHLGWCSATEYEMELSQIPKNSVEMPISASRIDFCSAG